MINNRLFLLIFLLAALLRSTALLSQNEHAVGDATTDSVAPMQLSMLSEMEDDPRTGTITRTVNTEDNLQYSEGESSQPVTETTAEKQFTDEELADLRKLFLQAENALKKKNDKKYFHSGARYSNGLKFAIQC